MCSFVRDKLLQLLLYTNGTREQTMVVVDILGRGTRGAGKENVVRAYGGPGLRARHTDAECKQFLPRISEVKGDT